jgi:hypothetical protein
VLKRCVQEGGEAGNARSGAPGFRHLGANRDPPQAEPQPPARRRTPATRPPSGGEPNPLTRLKMRLFDQADV